MKTEFKVNKAQLTTEEVGKVILEFKEEGNVTKAIARWFKEKYGWKTGKLFYPKDGSNTVIVEVVDGQVKDGDIPSFTPIKEKVEKENPAVGFTRKNRGVFKFLREYFTAERKSGARTITFVEIFKVLKEEFPDITDEKVNIYLQDKRQLPMITYGPKNVPFNKKSIKL